MAAATCANSAQVQAEGGRQIERGMARLCPAQRLRPGRILNISSSPSIRLGGPSSISVQFRQPLGNKYIYHGGHGWGKTRFYHEGHEGRLGKRQNLNIFLPQRSQRNAKKIRRHQATDSGMYLSTDYADFRRLCILVIGCPAAHRYSP